MTKVLIVMDGGVIESVYADTPETEYVVLDYDDYDPPDAAVDMLMIGFNHDAKLLNVAWPEIYRVRNNNHAESS